MLIDALKSGHLKKYFYQHQISQSELNQLYSECFLLFDQLWAKGSLIPEIIIIEKHSETV